MFSNQTTLGQLKKFSDIRLREAPSNFQIEDGYIPFTDFLLSVFNQWVDNQEYLANQLVRKTATGQALADFLEYDGLNLTGLSEKTQALLGVLLRGLHFSPYTWKTFEVIRTLLSEIGFTILPTVNDVLVYSLLRQTEDKIIIAKRVGSAFATPDGDIIAFANISDTKEIILFDGLKSLAETVVAVAIYDYYPWLRSKTNIALEPISDFGFGFFKDDITQEKNIWIGNFKSGVAHSSLGSPDSKTWKSYSENQIFASIVESNYRGFVNVTKYSGNTATPLMIGGRINNAITSNIYSRIQKTYGFQSNYSFINVCTAEFSPREWAGAVWFKDKLWVVGGLGQDDANSVDIWNSPLTDADKTFTLINDTPPWSFIDDYNKDVFGHCLVVFKDKMWFLGGQKTTNQFYNNIYSSEDGVNWVKQSAPPWSARSYFGAVSLLGRLYIFGGKYIDKNDLTISVYNDVWYTEDGSNWIEVGNADFTGRSHFGYLADEEKRFIYVYGGKNSSEVELNDFWSHYVI